MSENNPVFDYAGLLSYGAQSRDQLYTFFANNFKQSAAKYGYTGPFPAAAGTPSAIAAGRKLVGMGARRFPLIMGGMQALGGDPIGGAGTAGGGFAGAAFGFKLGGPVGALIGGIAGSGVGQSLARGLTGIDISDPYSGPEISIPLFGGIPITPAAKTKKSRERMRKETLKDLLSTAPLMEAVKEQDFAREQIARQMQLGANLAGQLYGR